MLLSWSAFNRISKGRHQCVEVIDPTKSTFMLDHNLVHCNIIHCQYDGVTCRVDTKTV